MNIQTKLKLLFLKYRLKDRLCGYKQKYRCSEKPRIWIFLGADYGNLGDVAITLSQERFLRKLYKEYEVITVPISETLSAIPNIKRIIGKDDIVTLIGGGNITDVYEDIEFLRQLVIKSFPDNKMISFPQSVYLTPTAKGEMEKKRIKRIYGSHKDFLILMRDKASFERMKGILPKANIRLAPDIVMSEDYRKGLAREKKILVCFRNDKESVDTDIIGLSGVIKDLEKRGYNIVNCDTQIDDNLVKQDGGEVHVKQLLDEISRSSLLITNRLHGMIFAFITGTPAIVYDNSTGKVSATYEWIKDCGFIAFNDGKIKYDNFNFTDNFDNVNRRINKLLSDNLKQSDI